MVESNNNERKTSEQIKEKILEALNEKPLNALEISKEIGSNWSTVKNYVEELALERKIKEISFRNQTFYQKIIEDTYFSIPIKEEERETLKFIFQKAIQKYRESKNREIRKTELAKLSAEINNDLKLNLPIVWYIYGPMPLMIMDIQKDYTPRSPPKNSKEIEKAIEKWIKENVRDSIRELRVEYYQKSHNEVYSIKEKIYRELENKRYNDLSNLLFEFLTTTISYDRSFEEIISELYGITSGASYIKLFNKPEFQSKFLLAFDSLWKYIASRMLIDSLERLGYPKESISMLLGRIMETKKHIADESISEIKEFYFENLPEKISPPKFTQVDNEMRKVLDKWMDSEVWRD